jgi:hypothetical protein
MHSVQCPPAKILTPKETVEALKARGIHRTVQTLTKLRCIGGGPAFVKIGPRQVGYPEPTLNEWGNSLISAPRRSTSEGATAAPPEAS